MINDGLINEYFEWMYQLVEKRHPRRSYRKLLYYLHSVEFTYTIGMDENRAEDGIDLRYRFGYERHYDDISISTCLDTRPCSVLEMMIALSKRCEENIMEDSSIGNRTSQWFWTMIRNLNLESMTDENFDREHVCIIILKFLRRKYQPNGEGGLFTVNNCKYDLRSIEIWYQMCWYLDGVLAN